VFYLLDRAKIARGNAYQYAESPFFTNNIFKSINRIADIKDSNPDTKEGITLQDQKPQMLKNEMYPLLREDKIDEFNVRRLKGEKCDLCGADLRGLDLRKLDPTGLDFTDAYLRQADIRGLDLRDCGLEGASLYGANISGTYFPRILSATEIRLSREFGIRMRYPADAVSADAEED
jgi:uncharacterized protein YjbI with pentapeptide repeats